MKVTVWPMTGEGGEKVKMVVSVPVSVWLAVAVLPLESVTVSVTV